MTKTEREVREQLLRGRTTMPENVDALVRLELFVALEEIRDGAGEVRGVAPLVGGTGTHE